MNDHDRAANRAATNRIWQNGDWSYLSSYDNQRLARIADDTPEAGTGADAERLAAQVEQVRRGERKAWW